MDVEAALVRVYREAVADDPGLSSAVVATSVPREFPGLLVTVSRSGGNRLSRVHDRPMVTTRVWAEDSVQAWELAMIARRAALAVHNERFADGWLTYFREVGGPAVMDDPRTKHASYQFTDTFIVREG